MATKTKKSASKSTAKTGASNLVIVESPAKAKTIEGYLGKDFKVVSCYGHVRDLPKKNDAIDIENGFKPTYVVSDEKKDVIKELRKLAKQAETIYLASDDDREGEAISWHLKEALKLTQQNTQRIVFREITKKAILKAIENPRQIDENLVNAQQARRILDRLVGFELSPVLWKKIKAGLSAGRVQSVAVRMVVEKERAIENFDPQSSFRVHAYLEVDNNKILKAELSQRFTAEKDALAFLEGCLKSEFSITDLQKRAGKKSPSPPFTTSTLQQEASRRLGMSVSQTMSLAQKLYEAGKITYMRTDSVNLSEDALDQAEKVIKTNFGAEFSTKRRFKTKSGSAQEAHEAIRPTNFAKSTVTGDREKSLYEMIWKRAIASQMSEAKLERTTATIGVSGSDKTFKAQGEVVVFEGFLKVYLAHTDDEDGEEKNMLPPLKVGQKLPLQHMEARQVFTKAPARYTEASLVKHLEEMGIGRPSTYAPTISTIQKRGYVVKESREGKEREYRFLTLKDHKIGKETLVETYQTEKNKLFPTALAKVVTDFLTEHFENVVNYSFTAEVEKEFDDISRGNKSWNKMIADFYFEDFHPKVEKTAEIDRSEVGTSREIGIDPKSGKVVIARLARFGPVVQIGETDGEEKPKYASLEPHQFLDTITLEEALALFKLPRNLGEFEDKEVVIGKGRFGPYVRHDGKFTSIPKGEDPMNITLERSIELILEKREADAKKFIKGFDEDPDIQLLNGRWGPYLKYQKQNIKLPKELKEKPEEITLEQCRELIANAPEKPKKGAKKTAAKKTTAKKTTAKKTTTKKAAAKKTTKKSPKKSS